MEKGRFKDVMKKNVKLIVLRGEDVKGRVR